MDVKKCCLHVELVRLAMLHSGAYGDNIFEALEAALDVFKMMS